MAERNIYADVLGAPAADFNAVRDGRAGIPQYIDIDLTVARSVKNGTALPVQAAGNFFLSDMDPDNQGAAVVRFQDVSQSFASAAPIYVPIGFMSQTPFTQFLVENAAQPGKRLRVIYGTDVQIQPGGSNQVNVAGTVSVIDGGKATSKSKAAFVAVGATSCAGAGQFMASALWNFGADRNLILSQLRYDSQGAGFSIIHRRITTQGAMSNDQNAYTKLLDGTQSTRARTIALNSGGALPALDSPLGLDGVLGARVIQFKEPIILPPGTGYLLANNIASTGASTLSTCFEFTEEAL